MNSKKKLALDTVQIVFGNMCSAFAVACFALPYDMVVAGITAVGRMVNYGWGFSITGTVAIINVILFIIGGLIIGKKFAASILLGTFLFPFFLGIFENMTQLHHLVNDPLLAAICAGILDGVGLGLIIRAGGSSGGVDVPPLILNRLFGWKIPPMIYMLDLVMFLIQIPVTETNGIILGILYALIYTVVMDKILVLNQGGVELMIFSPKTEEINEELLRIGFGTSIIPAVGGYLRDEKNVILSVVSSRHLNRVKKAIFGIDDKAFVTIANVSEINGNGFTTMFLDEDYRPDVKAREGGLDLMIREQEKKKEEASNQDKE